MKKNTRSLRIIIDVAMTAALPTLMAYALIGELFHEIAGVVMFVLFIVHLIFNRRFFKNVGKGKASAFRIVQVSVNIVLIIIMFVLPLSGIMTSRHIFVFLPTESFTSFSRTVHMVVSYWGFVIMSFHAGLHIGIRAKASNNKTFGKILGHLTLAAAMGYGVFAFIKRGIYIYMFVRSQFVFFDYSEPLAIFIIDYIAIMVLFAGGGYFVKNLIKNKGIL